jgi:YaiO family outer membrane protein
MKKNLNLFVFLLSFLSSALLVVPVTAQVDTTNLGTDDLFMIAREKAFNKQHEEARSILRLILQRSPSYYDVRILLGRTYAWDGKYDSARIELKRVLAEDPSHNDAYHALVDVELWSDQFEQALQVVDDALSYYPSDEEFLLKKARALKNLGRDNDALNVLNKLEDIHPSAPGMSALRQEIHTTSILNGIGINYATDRFSDVYDPMHYVYLQYSRRTPYGSMYGRLNYSNRFQAEGTQIEFDFYPKISDGMYGYVNYGFSNSSLFPKHRLGAEYYTSLPASFEGSLGFRYLYFGSGTDVTIYTGTLGYYYKSYWFSVRPYLTPGNAGTSQSISFTIRYYFGDVEDYLSVKTGTGFTPDERFVQSNAGFSGTTEVFHLKSQTTGIGFQKTIGIYILLVVTFDITNQELSFAPFDYVKMYSISVGLRLKF